LCTPEILPLIALNLAFEHLSDGVELILAQRF